MRVSHRTLVNMAAVTWYGGGVSLTLKGGELIGEAYEMAAQPLVVLGAAVTGLVVGVAKSRYIYARSCRKNLKRIAALTTPRVWQFFRPGFLLFLAIVIPLGGWMSRAAAGNFTGLCVVGAIDISLATALLVSGTVFWASRDPGRQA